MPRGHSVAVNFALVGTALAKRRADGDDGGMRHDEITPELRELAFDLFYWFSRFEFALKAAHFLKSDEVGAKAEPGWDKFIAAFEKDYVASDTAKALIAANPRRQVVGDIELTFRDVGFNPGASDLYRAVRLAQIVRNNLFHGGKHGSDYWDQPDRTRTLLVTTTRLLDELADMAGLGADYRCYY